MLLTPPPRPNRRPHCRDERERFGPLVLRACSAPLCTPPLTAPLRALHTQIDGFELKSAIRNSGAIAGMYKESLATFGYLVAATLAFDAGVFAFKGPEAAFDFLTAYFVEDSLSVDNLFVFLLLFRYFKVPPQLVDICLNYGITGSIVLRGIFIFAGLAAASVFAPVLLGFSVFLIGSSYSMLAGGDDDDEEEDAPPELVTDLLAKVPMTGTFEGEKFFVNTPEGLRATQLTGTLVCIALCDVLLAVDSTNPKA